jgi:hypothetical protein
MHQRAIFLLWSSLLANLVFALPPVWRTEIPFSQSNAGFWQIRATPEDGWSLIGASEVRVDANLNVLSKPINIPAENVRASVELSDGSVRIIQTQIYFPAILFIEDQFPSCDVQRLDRQYKILWQQRVSQTTCSAIVAATLGGVWLQGPETLIRLEANGRLAQKFSPLGCEIYCEIKRIAAASGPHLGGVFAVMNSSAGRELVLFSSDGAERWRRKLAQNSAEIQLYPTHDGGVYLLAGSLDKFDSNGQVRRIIAAGIKRMSLVADGVLVLDRQGECALRKFAADASLLWRAVLPCEWLEESERENYLRLIVNADSSELSAAAGRGYIAIIGLNTQAFFNANGALQFQLSDTIFPSTALFNASGNQLMCADRNGYKVISLRTQSVKMLSITWPTPVYGEPRFSFGPNGAMYVLASIDQGQRRQLSAITASGAVLWRKIVSADTLVGASHTMVCVLQTQPGLMSCVDTAAGALLFEVPNVSATLQTAAVETKNGAVAVYDDRVLVISSRNLLAYSKSGQLMYSVPLYEGRQDLGLMSWSFGPDGVIFGLGYPTPWPNLSSGSNTIAARNLDGQETLSYSQFFTKVRAFESGYLLRRSDGYSQFLDRNFKSVWYRKLPEADIEIDEGRALYLLENASGINGDYDGFALAKVSLARGEVLWRTQLALTYGPSGYPKTSRPNAEGKIAVYGATQTGAPLIEIIDDNDGSALGFQFIDDQDPSRGARLLENQVELYRSTARSADYFELRKPRFAKPLLENVSAAARTGLWFDPTAPGQGFMLAQSGARLTLNWLHNDWDFPGDVASDLLAPERQRWFLLDAQVSANATEIALDVYDNPNLQMLSIATQAKAMLSFVDRDHAFLRYQLPAKRCFYVCRGMEPSHVRGVIPLQRLHVPGDNSHPAKSGAFVDASGKQLLMSVASDKLLFVSWSGVPTPESRLGVTDKHKEPQPSSKSWFTLQANLTGDASGVMAPIYRTLGGRRDTSLTSVSTIVGLAALQFISCDKLILRYQFNADAFAKPFQNQQGEIEFKRVGACG